MADWKDMLAGTLGALQDKARELRESDAVEQVRRKLDEATEGTVVRSVYEQGAARTKIYAKIAKLSLGVNGQTEELKKVYAEIGKLEPFLRRAQKVVRLGGRSWTVDLAEAPATVVFRA